MNNLILNLDLKGKHYLKNELNIITVFLNVTMEGPFYSLLEPTAGHRTIPFYSDIIIYGTIEIENEVEKDE